MPEFVAIGAANVDIVSKVSRFPTKDDEVFVKDMKILGGGSAANVAVGVSRLGHSAGFVGLVGNDHFGDFLMKEFQDDDVDTSHTIRVPGSSGVVFAAIRGDGERNLYASEGIGGMFSREHIPLDYIRSAKAIHIANLVGDEVLAAFELAARTAKESGVKVVFDPGCMMAEKGISRLMPVLQHCDVMLPSEIEANMLTGKKEEEAAAELLKAGPSAVVITMGKEGCILATKDMMKRMPLNPKTNARIVDVTGGGDAFAAGFITGLIEGWKLEECVEFGMQVGYMSCGREGARGTPRREETKELLGR